MTQTELVEAMARAISLYTFATKSGSTDYDEWEDMAGTDHAAYMEAAAAILPILQRIRIQAVEAERARVVAWLGEQWKGRLQSAIYLADAIEHGDHLDGGRG